jgi:endo-1,4-beta-xylanase
MNEFTRRQFLAGGTALTLLGALGIKPSSQGPRTLREIAAEKGIAFGSALSSKAMLDDAYTKMFSSQCGILVPENELKWDTLRPSPKTFDFSKGDAMQQFAFSRKMEYRGHTLVWEGALPPWFDWYVTSNNAEQVLTEHISTVMQHYAGKIASWDVVNEAVQISDRRPDGLKKTPWIRLIGPEYLEIAFRAAHAADPNAKLVYNENWLEPDDADSETKRRAVLALLTNLKKRNVPLHGLGIQSHIFAEAQVAGAGFRRFLQEIEGLGLSILITEMDVRDQHSPADLQTRDRVVAEQYERYLSFVLQSAAVKTILLWGLSDRYTWIANHSKRPDGLPVRPLPYDSDLRPTASWSAIEKALTNASRR